MTLFLAALASFLALIAVVAGHVAIRIWRSSPATYETNRMLTGDFLSAASGTLRPLLSESTDFRINHFAEPRVGEGEDAPVEWERAGSLSDEAVDGVLARHR